MNFENENKFCSLEIFQPVPCTFPDLRPLLFLSFFLSLRNRECDLFSQRNVNGIWPKNKGAFSKKQTTPYLFSGHYHCYKTHSKCFFVFFNLADTLSWISVGLTYVVILRMIYSKKLKVENLFNSTFELLPLLLNICKILGITFFFHDRN
jgi:hypothetical protein